MNNLSLKELLPFSMSPALGLGLCLILVIVGLLMFFKLKGSIAGVLGLVLAVVSLSSCGAWIILMKDVQ